MANQELNLRCRFYPLPSENCERTIDIYDTIKRFGLQQVTSIPYVLKWLGIFHAIAILDPHGKDSTKIQRYCQRLSVFYDDVIFQAYSFNIPLGQVKIEDKGDC